jgi:hypothetical protein
MSNLEQMEDIKKWNENWNRTSSWLIIFRTDHHLSLGNDRKFHAWPSPSVKTWNIWCFKRFPVSMLPHLISSNVSELNLIDNNCNHHLSPENGRKFHETSKDISCRSHEIRKPFTNTKCSISASPTSVWSLFCMGCIPAIPKTGNPETPVDLVPESQYYFVILIDRFHKKIFLRSSEVNKFQCQSELAEKTLFTIQSYL